MPKPFQFSLRASLWSVFMAAICLASLKSGQFAIVATCVVSIVHLGVLLWLLFPTAGPVPPKIVLVGWMLYAPHVAVFIVLLIGSLDVSFFFAVIMLSSPLVSVVGFVRILQGSPKSFAPGEWRGVVFLGSCSAMAAMQVVCFVWIVSGIIDGLKHLG